MVIVEDCAEFSKIRGKDWVCDINNEIAGFLLAHLKDNTIWALFLKLEFEKQSIGKKFHNIMLDWYFSQTIDNVWLESSLKKAETFYKKAGWREIGIQRKSEIKFEMTYKNSTNNNKQQL